MLQSVLNSVEALSPEDGHILIVGDLWISQADCQQLSSNSDFIFNQCGAGLLALGAVAEGYPVTLAGFVGDDELADAIETNFSGAGVAADLLHIRGWSTFTDVALELPVSAGTEDASGRALRRHQDERALPINGMSEYQAHLQNRAERYLRNASALVLVDYDLGSIAEPRALTYAANMLNKPCVAMLGFSAQVERYPDVVCHDVTGQSLHSVVSGVMHALTAGVK